MPGTGPQRYPGASTAYYYQNRFGGDLMEVNVVVLHTTEGTTLPDYGGGAVAPNLTAVPDFAGKRLKWYQHFDIDRSSRALRNLAGGVETNTLNVVQVELVGTCDPATHKKWGSSPHIFWPEAPDWALKGVADFLAWAHTNHGIPLVGPSQWLPYPQSGQAGSPARMTFAKWEAFKGICGHQHVPENDHGDPGAIDFTTLIALAKGDVPEEDSDMSLTDAQAKQLADIATNVSRIAASQQVAPWTYKGADETRDAYAYLRGTNATVTALTAQVAGLSAALARLTEGGGLDAAEIQAAAEAGATAALDRLGDALSKEG